jgi:uncharacterized protein YrrD
MLNSVSKLQGFTAAAIDGEAGTIKDIYFDGERWTVRYFIVETGGWFTGRKVLVSPFAVLGADWANRGLRLNLTREQIRNGPDIDTDKPVSRQHESEFHAYYGYPYYWEGPLVWGYTPYPAKVADSAAEYAQSTGNERTKEAREQSDPHLRSSKEVIGYDIRATDDSVGHVDDFLIDDKDWSIQLMVVDTRNWWPGKKVLIAPARIDYVSWENQQIIVNVTRAEVENSPEYDPENLASTGSPAGIYRAGNRPTGNRPMF